MKKYYNVVVAGAGLAGVAAAVAAAGRGKRVLLIEQYGFAGGSAVSALVNPFMRYKTRDKAVNNAGLFGEILRRLSDMGGFHQNGETFNECVLEILLDRMLDENGVDVLFHTRLVSALRDGGRIVSVDAVGMSGQCMTFTASVFVDATGDAELTHLAGAPYAVGREEDGLCQPMTTNFRLGNVDFEALGRAAKENGFQGWGAYRNHLFAQAQQRGELSNPRENILSFPTMLDGAEHFNSTRVIGRSSLDSESYSAAETEGRRQVWELYTFLKSSVPGYQNAVLLALPAQIGVRESRRLIGEYTLTKDDVLSCVHFEDSIARGCYAIDIHNPSGTGTVRLPQPEDDYYTIPLRCLWTREVDNLVVAGRPISSDHTAHSAIRVLPICTCVGEAAGTLAAYVVETGRCAGVKHTDVQSALASHGACY